MSSQFLLVSEGGHVEPMASIGDISARVAIAGQMAPIRTDAAGRLVRDFAAYSELKTEAVLSAQFDAARAAHQQMAGSGRADDFASTLGGGVSPRDLSHRMKAALDTPMQTMTSEAAFPANSEIQPGALSWEQSRMYETGEAFVYRGGSGADIIPVGVGGATATGKVVYLISKATNNFLEGLVLNRIGAGLDVQARKMRVARDVIVRLINRWNWLGAAEHGIFGVYNNPYIDTALSVVPYTAASAVDDIVADFSLWANYAETESNSVYQPNQVAIAPKLAIYLATTGYGTNRDKTLWEFVLQANPHITRVVRSPELNDIGGTGVHGMMFSRIGSGPTDSSIERLTVMPPTLLPPDTRALGSDFYMVGATGGLHQNSAGDNLFVLVEGS